MDKKKKKNIALVRANQKYLRAAQKLSTINEKFDFDDVQKIILSNATQIAIGCVVGRDITIEDSWRFVDKSSILDNLELHENSSEFLPMKDLIEQYPEEQILFGYGQAEHGLKDQFFICTSVSAKDEVITILDEEKRLQRLMMENQLARETFRWRSLGSEVEIEDMTSRNLRPLQEIEINSTFPVCDNSQIVFKMRKVQDAKDGYVEILPSGRGGPPAQVMRRRLDQGVQFGGALVSRCTQTTASEESNFWTQSGAQTVLGEGLDDLTSIRLVHFLLKKKHELAEEIALNHHISNYYENEYEKFAHLVEINLAVKPEVLFSVNEVIRCKHLKVSSLSWHPTISGILAISFIKTPPFEIGEKTEEFEYCMENSEILEYPILIWDYNNQLKPMLYLLSPREVELISFCPHNGNIFVAGCKNGQVIIWDLSGKLEVDKALDNSEFLNKEQLKFRKSLEVHLNWFKNTIDSSVLHPTVVSNHNFSHTDRITAITWISPDHELNKQGRYNIVQPPNMSLQFVTASVDSLIYFWDIKRKPILDLSSKLVKNLMKRLQRDSAVFGAISPLRILNNILKPIYKLIVKDLINHKDCILSNLCSTVKNIKYTPVDVTTVEAELETTYYTVKLKERAQEPILQLVLTTFDGGRVYCGWEGYNFDLGLTVNFETSFINTTNSIHDGPIRTFVQNEYFDNCFLTVGGRVFAIWDDLETYKPIIWRKCHQSRYASGIWSPYNICYVIIARLDSFLEIWNLRNLSKYPMKTVRCTGNLIVDIYSDGYKRHIRKGTFGTSDTVGRTKLHHIPDTAVDIKENEIENFQLFRRRVIERHAALNSVVEQFKNNLTKTKYGLESDHEELSPEEIARKARIADNHVKLPDVTKHNETLEKIFENKWKRKEEKEQIKLLLKKKCLNLHGIEAEKVPLKKMLDQKRAKGNKLQIKLNNKENILKSETIGLIKGEKIKKPRVIPVIEIPKEFMPSVKKSYLQEYAYLETNALKFIERNRFINHFNLNDIIKTSKESRRKEIEEQKLIVFDGVSRKTYKSSALFFTY